MSVSPHLKTLERRLRKTALSATRSSTVEDGGSAQRRISAVDPHGVCFMADRRRPVRALRCPARGLSGCSISLTEGPLRVVHDRADKCEDQQQNAVAIAIRAATRLKSKCSARRRRQVVEFGSGKQSFSEPASGNPPTRCVGLKVTFSVRLSFPERSAKGSDVILDRPTE